MKPKLGDFAFAGSAERAAQWMLLNHRVDFDSVNGHARLMMEIGGRDGQGGSYVVDIIEGRVDSNFTGRRWQTEVLGLEEAQDRDREAGLTNGRTNGRAREAQRYEADAETARHFVEFLETNPTAASLSRIRECAVPEHMVGAERARRIMDNLVRDGRVEQVPMERGNHGYELRREEPHEPVN